MKLIKGFLLLNAVAWLFYGIYCLLQPALLTELTGMQITTPTAVTEVRAMYGGVQMAIGVVCLLALFNPGLLRPALVMLTFVMAGLALARTLGLLLDGSTTGYVLGAIAFEAVFAGLSGLCLRRVSHLPVAAVAHG
ncbi:MAG: DUF4345 domain-containing protein [Pseudomonadota bacterium]|nr:hypothetical protein [Pseudomonadales bacterium]MDY6921903.1 DUF4345 domain-containing protein [Pseudomonadota bacterium]